MRKPKNIHYIYKTTCIVTNRYYIGMHSTNNLDDGYLGSGKRLRRSIRKYGKESHVKEILEFFSSRELLVEQEKLIINSELIQDNNCMNLKEGGEGGFVNAEHYKKISKMGGTVHAKKMESDVEYRQKNLKILNENRNVVPPTFKGLTHSQETKMLMCNLRKGTGEGEKNSQYGTCWVTNGTENKKIRKEQADSFFQQGWVKGRTC